MIEPRHINLLYAKIDDVRLILTLSGGNELGLPDYEKYPSDFQWEAKG